MKMIEYLNNLIKEQEAKIGIKESKQAFIERIYKIETLRRIKSDLERLGANK